MELKEKVKSALTRALQPESIRIEDDDGITGFVVSKRFERMSSLDRQELLDELLQKSPLQFSPKELRRVLLIAALTPVEYESVGARIRVRRVKQMASGAVEITVQGDHADADYVRGALNNQKGVRTTEPKDCPGATGLLTCFRAKGTNGAHLTKSSVLKLLSQDRMIEVLQDA
ncbi:MAG: hypothetical protein HYS13_05960 [Planctomycetia bacterium]|nr:hypothetical protein [Planctomycetia bacterium]